jgi:UDP-N-acetylglucosamine--N-acetylmuramyl-(pentapeptide) pyrophosphoryl-undecaprenol N-acetylglucosamine transferase
MRRSSRRVRQILDQTPYTSVLALGGFVAAGVLPGLVSARSRGTLKGPIVLLNLDRIPGKANRAVARRADLVVSAVDTVKPGFASRITGLPVRAQAMAPDSAQACRGALGLDPDLHTILITGASQGASSLNRLMLRVLKSDGLTTNSNGYQVIHLTGTGEAEVLEKAYEEAGIRACVTPFMDQMGLAWGAASVTISRAGANSVGEIQANAVPTIFLPYPHHRDRHQFHNAQPLVDAGGALLIEDHDDEITASKVSHELVSCLADDSRLMAMSGSLAAQATPGAAKAVADLLIV